MATLPLFLGLLTFQAPGFGTKELRDLWALSNNISA